MTMSEDCRDIIKIRKDELDVPTMCDVELLADWKKYVEDLGDPNDEGHVWKLKYLVKLAFGKGWEAAFHRYRGKV